MARLNVNPTRMVLTGLKKRLQMARRGHKLLKDKQDELMKKFLEIVRENKVCARSGRETQGCPFRFVMARAVMSSEIVEKP